MIKFVCSKHRHIELEPDSIRTNKGENKITIEPCPSCREFARTNGKQYVYNILTRKLSEMFREKKEDDDKEEEEEDD